MHSALTLFQRQGYESTRVADIAALAGVSERTFFVHFPTKADILFDVPAEELEKLRTLILAQPDTRSDLHLLEAALLQFCLTSPEDLDLRHQLTQLLLAAASSSAVLRGRQLDYNQLMADTAAQAVARRHHELTPSLATLTAARTAFRIFHAIIIDWAEHEPGDLYDIAYRHFATLNSLLDVDSESLLSERPLPSPNGRAPARRARKPRPH